MKTTSVFRGIVYGIALTSSIAFASEVVEKTTTTTYSGTMSDVSPTSSTIVVKSESAATPMTYKYTKTTSWVDSAGNVITSEQARNSPVTVYYATEGGSTVVTKVVASKPSMTKETTTTVTETKEK
jgi:hypothetical protein